MIKVLGLSLYGELAASHRYRLKQYSSYLSKHGIELEIFSFLNDKYLNDRFLGKSPSITNLVSSGMSRLMTLYHQQEYACAIVHCELFPLMPSLLESRILRIPYIYDFDDAWYLRYKQGSLSNLSFILSDKIDSFIANAAAVTAGNLALASHALMHNENVIILPTIVDTDYYIDYSDKISNQDVFTIGWIGSVSTCQYLIEMIAPMEKLGLLINIRLVIVGGSCPDIKNIEIVELPWSIETEVNIIEQFDVGIMPLFDDEWSRGKCAFKLIQYMACGVPVVASSVGANIDLVTKECGFLVTDEEEWCSALLFLFHNVETRILMGKASRRQIVENYSTKSQVLNLATLIKGVAKGDVNIPNLLESEIGKNIPVSVIVPCFNCATTIRRAVLSIQNQTKLPSEVILIDDGSEDGTRLLLYELQKEYEQLNIKVIEIQNNVGVASARNYGIRASKFNYLAFLDADDVWLLDKNEKQYGWMLRNPLVAMTGSEYPRRLGGGMFYKKPKLRVRKVGVFSQLMSNRFVTSTVMCKRNCEIIFKEGKRHSEDYLLWLELIFEGNLAFEFTEPLNEFVKPPYFQGGLSGDLLAMEKGELDTYKQLFIQGRFKRIVYINLHLYSYIKYVRRLIICFLRRS